MNRKTTITIELHPLQGVRDAYRIAAMLPREIRAKAYDVADRARVQIECDDIDHVADAVAAFRKAEADCESPLVPYRGAVGT
jgi:hypothetical protein